MTKPVRVQRQRRKGWKMSPNTVYVGRPTRYGNPYTGPDAAAAFKEHLKGQTSLYMGPVDLVSFAEIRAELRGKNLACWCALDEPCHADVLLEIANK